MFKNISKISALALIFLLIPLTVPTIGCTVSTAQIESDINIVLTQSSQVVAALGDTAVAADIQKAQAALQQAEAAWKGGGTVNDVVSALNILEIAIANIPETAQYSAEVDVIVAGIEFVLTNLDTPTAAVKANVRAQVSNPHKGKVVVKPHMFQSPESAEKALWNKAVVEHPSPAFHKV